MSRSYLTVPYALRRAKGVERRMLVEAFGKLVAFGPLARYRYVGFGSPFFADFSLFHRQLGFSRMVNIETEERDKGRFQFNRPFGCVSLEFGESTDVLPRIAWDRRAVLWLDYDMRLQGKYLRDLDVFCQRARSGSLIVVTVDAGPLESDEARLGELKSLAGDDFAAGQRAQDLGSWGTAAAFRTIITSRLQEGAIDRSLDEKPRKYAYHQLFNFVYADGAMMLSTGGIIVSGVDGERLSASGLKELKFARTGDVPLEIVVPNVTARESRYLDSQLPLGPRRKLHAKGIPDLDLREYASIYRYYPHLVASET